MVENGKLYVFEGPDDSGKTTLAQELVKYFKGNNIECNYYAFPGNKVGTLGKHIRSLHHSPFSFEIETLNPASLQLLHVAAHIDEIESRILPDLRRGKQVILDRFWWSTWVYGIIEGVNKRSLQIMLELEHYFWAEVQPSVVFLLFRKAELYSNSIDKQERLTEEYTDIATRENIYYPVKFISNEGTLSEVLSKIILYVGRLSVSNHKEIDVTYPYQDSLPFSYENNTTKAPTIFSKLSPAKPTIVYETYWRFAAERQAIFFRRINKAKWPWTEDPILRDYKFTNAYRASDRVSQFLIKNVIYEGEQSPKEIFFRTLLFKFFNRIETWELLKQELETVSFADYSFERYDAVLSNAIANNKRIYSAAYIMPSGGPSSTESKKHRMHLKLLERMMQENLPARLAEASSMKQIFELLRAYPTIGDFLAYQYTIDLNYSSFISFSEMEFVVPGPGAYDGIRKCFTDLGGLNETEIIKLVTDRQQIEFEKLGLNFQQLWGRPLKLIDCQNIFCEVDKYARVHHPDISGISGRKRIKQKYSPNFNRIDFWYPPKWKLNI